MTTQTTTETTLTPWTSLELYTVDDDLVTDPETIRAALAEFRASGTIRDYYLGQIGAAHEVEDDVSTWGPASAADVDWTGFAPAYPADVAREVAALRPDLCSGDAVAAVLTADPYLAADEVIEALDEAAAEHAANLAHDAEQR